jgi:UDP-N-acetylglucosamine 2-epimerase (non-hydrolysing)
MREVIDFYLPKIKDSDILKKLSLKPKEYFLVSAHRQENVDSKDRLQDLLSTLKAVNKTWGLPVMVSTHPRTKKQLEAIPGYSDIEGITFHEPFGFIDYNQLQLNAKCVLSDSGTISEESIILGFPAVTIRDSMERPEALEFGGIVMTGLQEANVMAGIKAAIELQASDSPSAYPEGYGVTDCSSRVVKFMLSTVSRHHEWAGIRKLG